MDPLLLGHSSLQVAPALDVADLDVEPVVGHGLILHFIQFLLNLLVRGLLVTLSAVARLQRLYHHRSLAGVLHQKLLHQYHFL